MAENRRICGICKEEPRGNDYMPHPIRITKEDIAALGKHSIEEGLYQCCQDCRNAYRPIMIERLKSTPHPEDLRLKEEFQRTLLPKDAHPLTVSHQMLM